MRERENYENPIDKNFEQNSLMIQNYSEIFDYLTLGDMHVGGKKISSSIISSYLRYPSCDNIQQLQEIFGFAKTGEVDKKLLESILALLKTQGATGVAMPEWKNTVHIPEYNREFTLQNRSVILQYLNEWQSLDTSFDHKTYVFYALSSPTIPNIMKLQEKLNISAKNQDGYFGPTTLQFLQKRVETEKAKNMTKVLSQKDFTKLRGKIRIEDYSFYIQSAKKLLQAGDNHGFYKDIEEAIKLDPKNPEPYILRGNHLRKIGNLKSAAEDYSYAQKLGTNDAEVLHTLKQWGMTEETDQKKLLSYNQLEEQLIKSKKIRSLAIENRTNEQYYKLQIRDQTTIFVPTANIVLEKASESLAMILDQFNELLSKKLVVSSKIYYYNDKNTRNKNKDIAVIYKENA